ncbi:hypothetical protein ATCC90586_000069 [Pythium insidiosum]|nr:hypothetical protein ATCC90586_000069 [Pythium insidiosum]
MRSPSRVSFSSNRSRTPSASTPPLPREEETLFRCEAWLPPTTCGGSGGGVLSFFTNRRHKEPSAVPLTLFSAIIGVSVEKDTGSRASRALLLRLGDRAPVVVVSPLETTVSPDNPEVYPPSKTTLTLDVKSEDDVRRSLRYGVATSSAPLDVLVDARDAPALLDAIKRFFYTVTVMSMPPGPAGPNGSEDIGTSPGFEALTRPRPTNEVDRIIQQAMDEVALNIQDELEEDENDDRSVTQVESDRIVAVLDDTLVSLESLGRLHLTESDASSRLRDAGAENNTDEDDVHEDVGGRESAVQKAAPRCGHTAALVVRHRRIERALLQQRARRTEQRVQRRLSAVDAADDPRPETVDKLDEEPHEDHGRDAPVADHDDDEDDDESDDDDDEQDWETDARRLFPKSLHSLVTALRCSAVECPLASDAPSSPSWQALCGAWRTLTTLSAPRLRLSCEQQDIAARDWSETARRLREIEDDRQQVLLELRVAQDARREAARASRDRIESLRVALSETQRQASEAMDEIQRGREQDAQRAATQLEADRAHTTERGLALARKVERLTQANEAEESASMTAVRLRVAMELADVVRRYDESLLALDDAIAQEATENARIVLESARLEALVARMDDDRREQLAELQAIEAAERARRLRDLNAFRLIQRVQAVIRGFLARRQMRGQLKKKAKKKKKGKGAKKTKAAKRTPASSPSKKKATSARRR